MCLGLVLHPCRRRASGAQKAELKAQLSPRARLQGHGACWRVQGGGGAWHLGDPLQGSACKQGACSAFIVKAASGS